MNNFLQAGFACNKYLNVCKKIPGMTKTCINCKQLLLFVFSFCLCSICLSQSIRGKITDANTGEPLVGATVKLDGTKYVTLVKLDGSFIFTKIPAAVYHVITSYAGYEKTGGNIEISIAGNENKVLNFSLRPSEAQLQSVIISAAGDGGRDGNSSRLGKNS